MKIIRKSLINKAVLFFVSLLVLVIGTGSVLYRSFHFTSIPLGIALAIVAVILLLVLITFVMKVYAPISRVTKQIHNLLTGKNYRRVSPTTIDEVGVITHFFNEITRDLEKISYDVKERRRMSSELDIASSIQKDVLPKEAPEVAGLDIVAKTRSAAEVGGDTFDFLNSADNTQFFIYIGDVTGHGVPAGLIMMMVDTLITAMVYQGVSSGRDLIVHTNRLLTPRISSRLFMTAVLLRWDKEQKKMHYTGAGHEHVLIYHARTETVEAIPSGGIALGMIPDVANIVRESAINLEVGDSIVLYSDGMTEAKNDTGDMYGLEKITQSLKRNGYRPSAENIFDNLTKDFSVFVGPYVQVDDITMIVIKYVGEGGATSKIKLEINNDDKTQSEGGQSSAVSNWNWS